MSTNQTPLQRPNRLGLTHDEETSLRYGDDPYRPAFASEEERRTAWFRCRERLLMHCSHGKRPSGWWDFESPVPYPRDPDYAEATLYEAGLLAESEVAELTAYWCKEFERASSPRFMFCIGHAKPGDTFASWISGEPAKKAHLKWAGVPRSLIGKWTTQRGRRSRTVRQLEKAAAAEHSAA